MLLIPSKARLISAFMILPMLFSFAAASLAAAAAPGTVVGWGYAGDAQYSLTPPVGLSGVTAIDAGGWHGLALKSDGTVVAWGWNDVGETDVPRVERWDRHLRRIWAQPGAKD